MRIELKMEEYIKTARKVAADSCVLIKNDKNTLPVTEKSNAAVFGINAFHYYKSGLGSGGLVNTRYTVDVLGALESEENIEIDTELKKIYENWIEENPFDEGKGWGTTPWAQKEMPLSDEIVTKAASKNDMAFIMIGRTAGEDQDNSAEAGSYLLTDVEEDMLEKVCKAFERTVVILNTGNIIDMKWVEKYAPSAVLYVWQGGQEGGNGVADVITGRVNPAGRLTDTVAYDIADYPSTDCFGDEKENIYKEDIFVGYRYFETAAKEKVMYPFGYGLSYTTFEIKAELKAVNNNDVVVTATVKNTGDVAGRQVVQVYVEAPQGRLGKASRVLAGFGKTKELAPGESDKLEISCNKNYFASYDDTGRAGARAAFILEKGEYYIYAGENVRDAVMCGSWKQKEQMLQVTGSACQPAVEFDRMCVKADENGKLYFAEEKVEAGHCANDRDIRSKKDSKVKCTGDAGYVLRDVKDNKVTMEEFIAQIPDEELIHLMRGEGMCSPKATPGVAAAFGGLTDGLKKFGIPVACCADGPSGIRMDCGTKAFSLPNGTALGCTFDMELVEELFGYLGYELRVNKIDSILGPGINIHRSLLNGRNFEYISEDPMLTGVICAAQLKGLHKAGVEGTIKHFCANNQEKRRTSVNAVISERALREIYLKPFEIAVVYGEGRSIMTTYGPVNGIWTAGNYDLCTNILRKDWGYTGIVMTDWWANANWAGEDATKENKSAMVIAQNDLYMCCADTVQEDANDDLVEALASGRITREHLVRNAKNILEFIMNSPAMDNFDNSGDEIVYTLDGKELSDDIAIDKLHMYNMASDSKELVIEEFVDDIFTDTGMFFGVVASVESDATLEITISTETGELAQIPVSVFVDNIYRGAVTFRGTSGNDATMELPVGYFFGRNHYIKLAYPNTGVTFKKINIKMA